MGEVFFNPLDELADYQSLNEDLRREKGPVSVSGCMDSQKVHLMYEAAKDVPWKLVVTYDDSAPGRFTTILNISGPTSGCIRRRICCFTALTSTETC